MKFKISAWIKTQKIPENFSHADFWEPQGLEGQTDTINGRWVPTKGVIQGLAKELSQHSFRTDVVLGPGTFVLAAIPGKTTLEDSQDGRLGSTIGPTRPHPRMECCTLPRRVSSSAVLLAHDG
jgi:hypothetical protein